MGQKSYSYKYVLCLSGSESLTPLSSYLQGAPYAPSLCFAFVPPEEPRPTTSRLQGATFRVGFNVDT